MARIEPIELDQATGKAKELLDELTGRGGEPGPMVLAMANAPALLSIPPPKPFRTHLPENRMSNPYLAWAAAVGAAGCGRCANAV